ncbi:leucine-rich repeat domain-containing protein [Prevotella sp. oral taxon 475]|uniref:leucine-rich repeat domain-containing protein n=1 Tax=Prevotella sp. oral taxon 475 TaxID=712471 RepID=UPI001BA7B2C5|nr:leucine-rich repeat domain-containing protein [Prevotella sp. oral taxon 475]QUB46861.1 leucine-rich repeat domain-containing protein [Prevotella sp. oral taxon 475]
MKRILFLVLLIIAFMKIHAQGVSYTFSKVFSKANSDGVTIWYGITDATKRTVAVTYDPAHVPYSSDHTYSGTIKIPSTVEYNSKTYTVTGVGRHAFQYSNLDDLHFPSTVKEFEDGAQINYGGKVNNIYLPENMPFIGNNALWYSQMKHIWIPSGLKKVEGMSLCSIGADPRIHGFAESNIEEIGYAAFFAASQDVYQDLAVLPQTIRILDNSCFSLMGRMPLDKVTIPASMEKIGSNVYDIANDVYIKGTTPFTLANNAFGTQSTLKIHMEVDRTFAFATAAGWSSYVDKFVEEVKLGSTGYISYYLENENFKVPAGCTAYIITGITKSSNPALPDQANVIAFTAGKIIPKQTGFILKGTANSTVVYQANVTGTEESVAGNWLVGTAIEQEFSSAGHKYYVLANGDKGIGFYKQGTRKGASIKLQPHRAGLRLADAVAPAKGLIIDFDAAREEAETTGIRDVRPSVQPHEDIIYDLQGRRVTNPGRGIYIVNGKKVVRE